MHITFDMVAVWLIVGALAGSLTGVVVKRRKEGFGRIVNLGLGLLGALIGGFLFQVFHINLGNLAEIKVSLQDVVAAFLGSLLVLAVVWGVQKYRKK